MSKREYLIQLKKKYWRSGKKQKTQLLDDFCEFTKYHRKYALALLNHPLPKHWKRYKQRAKKYDQAAIDTLLVLWRAVDEICAERLHPYIPELLGYAHFDKKDQQTLMNDLYADEWRLYLNFFQPTMKLEKKIKDVRTGKTKKKYYEAKTPFQRLLEHPKTTQTQKDLLLSIYQGINPITLKKQINKKIELIRKTLK